MLCALFQKEVQLLTTLFAVMAWMNQIPLTLWRLYQVVLFSVIRVASGKNNTNIDLHTQSM